jgi:hypothetical protein
MAVGMSNPPFGYPAPVKVLLEEVKLRKDLWPRSKPDARRVKEFAALMKAEDGQGVEALPPIIVRGPYGEWRERYWLEDGLHRCEAARRVGLTEILAHVLPPCSDAELRLAMVTHSATSNLPLTADEKQLVAPRLRADGQNDTQIANLLGVTRRTVYNWIQNSGDPISATAKKSSQRKDPLLAKGALIWRGFEWMWEAIEDVDLGDFCPNEDKDQHPHFVMGYYLREAAEKVFGVDGDRWLTALKAWCDYALEGPEGAEGLEEDEEESEEYDEQEDAATQ